MIISIFKKAELLKEKVVMEGEAHNRLFFTFKDMENPPAVTLVCNGQYTYLENCTCMQHTIRGPMPDTNMKNLCSYVLSIYKCLPIKGIFSKKVEDKVLKENETN